MSAPANKSDLSLPLTNVASAPAKPANNELLMASVPAPEGTPTPGSEQPTPTDSAPPFILPRAKLSEDIVADTNPASPVATSPRSSDSLESKLAPAAVSESELIQPHKKPYMDKKNKLPIEAKDLSEASKVPLRSKL